MANLKAMDSDWFAQTYMGRKSKVGACMHVCECVFTLGGVKTALGSSHRLCIQSPRGLDS